MDEETQSLRLTSFSLCENSERIPVFLFFLFDFIPTGIIYKWRLNKKTFPLSFDLLCSLSYAQK